jgi:hypothetical protein
VVNPMVVQSLPQLPQLFTSVWKLVHVPLQASGIGSMHMPLPPSPVLVPPSPIPPHEPPTQVVGGHRAVQSLPQLPQLKSSLLKSTQALAQQAGVVSAGICLVQSLPQLPQFEVSVVLSVQVLAQHALAGQTVPQALQLFGSEVSSTQVPPQQACVAVQAFPQDPQFLLSVAPSTHLLVQHNGVVNAGVCIVQSVPHIPQLLMSVVVLVHVPVMGGHCTCGAVHIVPHTPLEQVWPMVHAWPHEPQLRLSVWVLAQAVPHWVWPVGQGVLHVPVLQVAPLGQAFPHAPQFCESVCVFTQAPLHSIWGLVHIVVHLPVWQVWPVVQTVPHEPQLELSV